MKHFYQFFLIITLLYIPACAPMHQQTHGYDDGSVELPQDFNESRYALPYGMTRSGDMDMAKIMSNENVIVYPVYGDLNSQKREFPEYRSVMENTTAGGYTVFDPSVTVYAVEGGNVQRPSYLPEYAIPKYVQPLQQTATIKGDGSLMPVPLTHSYGDEIIAEPLPRAPRLTQAGTVSVPTDRVQGMATAPTQTTGRRSAPMLTGY